MSGTVRLNRRFEPPRAIAAAVRKGAGRPHERDPWTPTPRDVLRFQLAWGVGAAAIVAALVGGGAPQRQAHSLTPD
jgi:hypothetical protein